MQYCSYCTQWVQSFSSNSIVFFIQSIDKECHHIRLNRYRKYFYVIKWAKLVSQHFLQKSGCVTWWKLPGTHKRISSIFYLNIRNFYFAFSEPVNLFKSLYFAFSETVNLFKSLYMQHLCVYAFLCKKIL